MGQKVNPHGFRLKIINDWKSRWFATKEYPTILAEDLMVRDYLEKRLEHAALSRIEIERASNQLTIDIFTARPGVVIGKKGSEVDQVKSYLEKLTGKLIQLNILEVARFELDAKLVAKSVAEQLVGRVNFRRAMKRAVTSAMRAGAKGIKISCSGRLGGAEMARNEWYREGRVPLHTLKADIDYSVVEANTTFGKIGVKVWIYKGDIESKQIERIKAEKFRDELRIEKDKLDELKETSEEALQEKVVEVEESIVEEPKKNNKESEKTNEKNSKKRTKKSVTKEEKTKKKEQEDKKGE